MSEFDDNRNNSVNEAKIRDPLLKRILDRWGGLAVLATFVAIAYTIGSGFYHRTVSDLERVNFEQKQRIIDLEADLESYKNPVLVKSTIVKVGEKRAPYIYLFGGKYRLKLEDVSEFAPGLHVFTIQFSKAMVKNSFDELTQIIDSVCFWGKCVTGESVYFSIEGSEYYFIFNSVAQDTAGVKTATFEVYKPR